MRWCLLATNHHLSQVQSFVIGSQLISYLNMTFSSFLCLSIIWTYDEVIKWKHFPHYKPFVWGIHRSPTNSPHKAQWRRALMFSLNCAWTNNWANNGEGQWFEMPLHSLWYHCNEYILSHNIWYHPKWLMRFVTTSRYIHQLITGVWLHTSRESATPY